MATAIVAIAAISGTLLIAQTTPRAPRFFPDDPIARVPESQDASGVRAWETSLAYDILVNSFAMPGDRVCRPAQNVNTIDEVPDSGWFTNRLLARPLTTAEVARGPDEGDGPADGPLTIVASKQSGLTPGFTLRDRAGTLWFVKFDPPGYLELASGAEVVATKLFHALGYFVPENHAAYLRRAQLVVGPEAKVKFGGAPARPMRDRDIDRLLARAARAANGSYRVLASRALTGKPIGAFDYLGRRSDDPNDLVPHENRRELRALRVFAAWTQHVDSKGGNSLDMLVRDGDAGRARVRHHLIDLGSTLGSAGIKPRDYNEGHESLVEPDRLWRGIVTLGFDVAPWRTIPYPNLPALGRFEGDHFEPDAWVPSVPNPAFLRARPDDLFWGARRVMAFTDDLIHAAVESGRYTDPAVRRALAAALIERRNRIGRAWLPIVNPIVDPVLDEDGTLTFTNAAVAHGAAPAPSGGYAAAWYRFDNDTGEATPIGESNTGVESNAGVAWSTRSDTTSTNGATHGADNPGWPGTLVTTTAVATAATAGGAAVGGAAHPRGRLTMTAPRPAMSSMFVRVDVRARGAAHAAWERPIRLYFRRDAARWTLVGLERDVPATRTEPPCT